MKRFFRGTVRTRAFPFFFALRASREVMARRRRVRALVRGGFGRLLSGRAVGRAKRSDTLFVLGSGASVNAYGDEMWRTIAAHDSLGLNYWVIHDFVPTFLVFEVSADPVRSSIFYQWLHARRQEYRSTLIIRKDVSDYTSVDDMRRIPPVLRDNVYFPYELVMPGETAPEVRASLRWLARLGMFSTDPRFRLLAQRRATLSFVLSLAVRMGYRNVVLCGVDLNNTGYFYEENAAYYLAKGIPVPDTGQVGAVHSTVQSLAGGPNIVDVLRMMREEVLDARGVRLYSALATSALHPTFPVYSW